MACIPALAPLPDGIGQMAGVPLGDVREDQYGAARPLGSCSPDGSIECLRDGTGWAMCDYGGWIDMGDVAPGTQCVNGDFVSSP
jgi:hypothetical protein